MAMFQTLHASHNGDLYRVYVNTCTDIADLVRDHHMETATSGDGSLAFWFARAARKTYPCITVNRHATELLLAATAFTAREVPLLRGNIVITGKDSAGGPAGLSAEQMQHLINTEPTSREQWVLERRYSRDRRDQRRIRRHAEATRLARI